MPIRSFKDGATSDIAQEISSKRARKRLPPELHGVAYRKLVFLEHAQEVRDITEWRSLRFERLKGDRLGQISIRINDQYRICFRWHDGAAHDVEILDYH